VIRDRGPVDEIADVHHTVDGITVGNSFQEIDVPGPHTGRMRVADDQDAIHSSTFSVKQRNLFSRRIHSVF
jgi:hypothetical protein